MNRLKSEDEHSTETLVSDYKNSVDRIVSLLGLGWPERSIGEWQMKCGMKGKSARTNYKITVSSCEEEGGEGSE